MWLATSRQVDQFRVDLNNIVAIARAEAEEFWHGVDKSDPAYVRGEMIEFMQDLNLVYGDVAASVAADYFEDLRSTSLSAEGTYQAVASGSVPVDQVAGSTGWALSTADPLASLVGVADRLIKQVARDTVVDNVARDRAARYVRVPRGPETCAFCLMLASRGAVYSSGEVAQFVSGRGKDMSAGDRRIRATGGSRDKGGQFVAGGRRARGSRRMGDKYHDFCDCQPVAIWSARDYPDTYDYKKYNDIYLKGVAEAGGAETKKVLAGIRLTTGHSH